MTELSGHSRSVQTASIAVFAAMLGSVLAILALVLWMVFGGDVLAQLGSAAWALCF
jgi:hypothetical protein